jgi:hypothetical protein
MTDRYKSDPQYREMITSLIKADGDADTLDLSVIPRKPSSWGHPMIICVRNNDADLISKALSKTELQKLIRSLVKYSRVHGPRVSGGSASPVVFLYSRYCDLYPEDEADMTAWIVDNRVNEYEPFGTRTNCDTRSISARLDLRDQRRKEVIAIENEQQETKRLREGKKATENLPYAIRRGDLDAINELLDKGADTKEASHILGPLQKLAIRHKRDKALRLLIDKGIL